MNATTLRTLAASAAFAAAGAPLTASANTLVVPQDTSISVTSSAAYDAVEVHGSLSVTGTSASGTILSLNDGGTMAVGADSGDNAAVSIGDYAQLKTIGGATTIGGNGGTGLITLGGRRINNAADILTDAAKNTATFYSGNIWAAADANPAAGVIDLVRLNEGGLMLHPQNGCKIVNPSTACDARILFNGGVLAINEYCGKNQFQSASGGLIASGNGGKAIVLESENGHPIDLRYRWGSETTAPVLGTVKTAGDGSMRVWGETGSANHFGWLVSAGNFIWGHKGDLELANNFCLVCGAADVLPCLADGGDVILTGDSPYNWLNLNRHSQSINGLVATGCSMLTNGNANVATLTFGAARPDGTLQAPVVGGKINVRKTGAGTLTITNTADFAKLTVESGTVRFCRNAAGSNSIGVIELAAGSALVVDGTIVRASVRNAGASVTCLNGGRLISTTSSDSFAIVPAEDAGGASCEWVKTGAGTLAVVATNLITIPLLHVSEGTLRLSAGGTEHPWLRFSFTAMNPSSANFCLSEIKVMDASGNRVDGGGSQTQLATTDPFYDANVPEGSDVANAASDTTPVTMTPKSVWASDATFSRNNTPGYKERSPSCLFDGKTYTKLQYSSKATAANPKVFVLRLPSDAANAAGYLFRNGYSGSTHPSAWTLESSPDGANWTTVDSKSGVVPPSSNGTWYNGGEAWPIHSGDVPGAAGFMPTVAVRVDEGAALDCSLVTGGQTLSNIVVDWALGGGTIRNAVFAANGTLSVVNAPDANLVGGTEIPLDFDGVSGTENLRDWTLVVNGVSSSKRIRFSNGRIAVGDSPTVMVIR